MPLFEGVRYTEDVLLSLPRPIAVVGNATPNRAWGAVIDRYATVIRLNNFRTQGFEALVGHRTDVRCTSAWDDIEHRDLPVELSPFTASARESANLRTFNAANARPVLAAYADVRAFIPEVPNPSTGLALVQLLELLQVPADLFGFDGFRTAHYWRSTRHAMSHSNRELDVLRSRAHATIYGELDTTPPPDDETCARIAAVESTWQWLDARGLLASIGRSLIDVGGLGERVRADLQRRGVAVASTSLSALAFLETPADCCVALGLIDTLAAHEVRVFVRQAARLSPRLLATARSDDRQRLDDVIRSVSMDYEIEAQAGAQTDQVLIQGTRRVHRAAPPPNPVVIDPHYDIHRDYQTRPVPIYFPDVDDGTTWQPDVYRLLRDLARVMDCQGVIDLGCGQGRKLAGLHPEFAVLGVDTGANLEYCRSMYAFGTWVDANLERPQAQTLNGHALDHRAIVCADVIEHLIDPTGLMDTLRDVLTVAPFAILTTPERDLTHGREHNGPPPNPAHVREWNLAELRRYAESHRLDVAFAGMTASHSASFERKTSLLLLCGRSLSASRREGLVAACEALLGRYDAERAGDRDAWMRQCDALARERDAAHAEAAGVAAALTAQRLDTHRTLLRRMLIRVRRARARTVTIVGAGEIGRVASAWLAEAGISTVSIGDNDMQRWGDTWNGLRVCSVAASLDPAADAVIIASVAHARPLRRQVRRLLLRQRRTVRIFSPTG